MKSLFKILAVLFAIFFVFSAVVQFNDPDSWLWILLYSIGAIVSVLFMLNKARPLWAYILMILYIVLAIYHWPAEFEGVALKDGMKTMNIELGRESLGMAISAIAMLILGLGSQNR